MGGKDVEVVVLGEDASESDGGAGRLEELEWDGEEEDGEGEIRGA
jgi:hypothetical protein